MADGGVSISELRASVDEAALASGTLRLTLEGVVVRLGVEAARVLQPPGGQFQLERISPGKIHVRTRLTAVGGVAEIAPGVTSSGRLRLEITSFRAAGLISIPISAVMWAARNFAPDQPGLHFGERGHVEIDLQEALKGVDLPPGIALSLPRFKSVTAGEGFLEVVL